MAIRNVCRHNKLACENTGQFSWKNSKGSFCFVVSFVVRFVVCFVHQTSFSNVISYFKVRLLQECIATIPPLPFRDADINPLDFDCSQNMEKVMFGRPELMFTVKLRPFMSEAHEIFEVPLIFFAAFERIRPDPRNEMQCVEGIIQLYKPGPYPAREPILHVGVLAHVLCRVPLVPCYLGGNQFPTAPHGFSRA